MSAAQEGDSACQLKSLHSQVKTVQVMYDRCKQIVEGLRGEEVTAGFYDVTKWEEYRREQYACQSCIVR